MARPIPCPAPVMTATLPVKSRLTRQLFMILTENAPEGGQCHNQGIGLLFAETDIAPERRPAVDHLAGAVRLKQDRPSFLAADQRTPAEIQANERFLQYLVSFD